MAETKYAMLLENTGYDDKKIRNKPWWKERLHTRYIKSLGPQDTSKHLQGKNWTFLKDGLDDFRDGLPPPVEDGILIKNQKGLGPNLQGSSANAQPVKQPVARHRFNKHEMCYSKSTPLQQQRRDNINETEYGLMQHPLALYPHLEESLPPDLFEDVVDILDPEMNMMDGNEASIILEEDEESLEQENEQEIKQPQKSGSAESRRSSRPGSTKSLQGEEGKVKNPYRWLPRKEEIDKKNKKKAMEKQKISASQDEHIKKVTKDFCDWAADLGGETNNIEESTITSLFASGYETKPALSVPIHVVELTNVPPELRMSASVPPDQQNQRNIPDDKKQDNVPANKYEPSWVKFKYGAWYLKPKTWKKRGADEPLIDPQVLKNQEISEAKKKSNSLDSQLAEIHGTKAYMEFIDTCRSNARKPQFLEEVAKLQEQMEEEKRKELEKAEQAAHRKNGKS